VPLAQVETVITLASLARGTGEVIHTVEVVEIAGASFCAVFVVSGTG
jgi:hypothetical protein